VAIEGIYVGLGVWCERGGALRQASAPGPRLFPTAHGISAILGGQCRSRAYMDVFTASWRSAL